MITISLKCCHCDSENLVRNGRTRNGKQRYLCHDCGRTSRDNLGSNAYPTERREEILRAYQGRSSLRGLSRTFGVSRNTVSSWLKKDSQLPALNQTLLIPQEPVILELDELWSFALKRAHKRWVWLALCRQTRQVVAYVIGDRSEATCRRLWQVLPAAYRQVHCYTDLWDAYQAVIPADQHTASGKATGQTNHIERGNNTLRQRLARFVRRTLSFSKSEAMHEICLRLSIHRYNAECLIAPR